MYQALGCRYVGTSKARFEDQLPDGTVLTDRSASKVRRCEQGAYGVVRRLTALGADDPGELCSLDKQQRVTWLKFALVQVGARRVRLLGKHRYLLCVGDRAQRRTTLRGLVLPSLQYPKHDLLVTDLN